MANTKGYVKLRRGLLEHLPIMSNLECKVYISLLLMADFNTGVCTFPIGGLESLCDASAKYIRLALGRLEAMGYIEYAPAVNQWRDNTVKIVKYASVNMTEPTTEPTTEAQGADQQEEAPKNYKKSEELEEEREAPPQRVGKSLWDEITDKLIDEWTKRYPSRPDPDFIKDIRKRVFQSVSSGQKSTSIASALKRIYEGEHVLGFGRYVTEAAQGRSSPFDAELRKKAYDCLKEFADVKCATQAKSKWYFDYCKACERGENYAVSKT